MKKQILLFASIAISTLTMAQLKPSFGVRGGVTSSGMRGDAVSNLQSILDYTNGVVTTGKRTGFFAGAYTSIPLWEVVAIEPGLYYSQKGYEMTGSLGIKNMDFLGANAKAQLQSQYIDLPVVVKANFGGFQVFAGPQVSYLAKSDLRTTAGVLGFNLLNKKFDVSDQFNKWDAAVTGGIGYQFSNGLNISAAYDHGLSKVDRNSNLSSYNQAFKVGVGMSF